MRPLNQQLLGVTTAGVALVSALAAAPAAAAEDVVVHPGMEIRQDTTVCTVGFVDEAARIAFSAGHCRGSGPVTDRNGRFIGMVANSRDNTPDGTVVRTDQVIADYQTISLAPGVVANNVLPDGRPLVAAPVAPLSAGQPVCHFGVITGRSCGVVERVNNGWFTMGAGVVSQRGDSGGPVYTVSESGDAVIVGLFNSTWGRLPAAVSWQAANEQLRQDSAGASVVNAAATQQN